MIFFLHIPKTGGQTLGARLAAGFAPQRCSAGVRDVADRDELHGLSRRLDFLAGHPGYGVLDDPPAGLDVLALVREPVEQMASLYAHIRRDPHNPLHAAAAAMPASGFFDRFEAYLFNFQARTLAMAWRAARVPELVRGEEAWLARALAPACDAVRWLVPTERMDEFCGLWRLETGRPVGHHAVSLNVAAADDRDAAGALRAWLRGRPERFAADSLLWRIAQRRFGGWRGGLLAADAADGEPPASAAAWRGPAGEGVWLTQDWHPPQAGPGGTPEWWAGPGFFPRLRVRRTRQAVLRFEALTFLGVHWDQVRFLRAADLEPLPHSAGEAGPATIAFAVELDGLGPEGGDVVLTAVENAAFVPAAPIALGAPRRAFATRGWRLE